MSGLMVKCCRCSLKDCVGVEEKPNLNNAYRCPLCRRATMIPLYDDAHTQFAMFADVTPWVLNGLVRTGPAPKKGGWYD